MKHISAAGLAAGLLLALVAPAGAATVTVQVEGQSQVLAPTTVTTPAAVTDQGQSCDGATAIGALQVATAGAWSSGPYAFTPEVVLGERHAFSTAAGSSYWSFYVNGLTQNQSACQTKVKDGDEVLFYAADDPFTAGAGGYDEPVVLTAPATVAPGTPFTVTVREAVTTYDANGAGTTTLQPSSGATVTAGAATATTAADGRATLTLPGAGPVQLVARNGTRAPDRQTVCATTGDDGQCGSPAPAAATVPGPPPPCVSTGDDGRCGTPDRHAAYGFVTGIAEGRRFARGRGPRELTGRVDDEPSGVKDVQVRLTGNDHGRCAAYDGRRERLVALRRCGATHGAWFSVGRDAQWRYLLPARLGAGRWVLDVKVTDNAGNVDSALARGRNRVVFVVA